MMMMMMMMMMMISDYHFSWNDIMAEIAKQQMH